MGKIVLGLKYLKHLFPHTSLVLNKYFVVSHCTLFLCRGTVKIFPVLTFTEFEKNIDKMLTNMAEIGEISKSY